MEKCKTALNRRDRGSCSTVIVGKDASVTGRVLLAHNEDDYDCTVQVHMVPRVKHKEGDTITFGDAGAVIPEVAETYAYYWSEMRAIDGISFADGFVNEWGVAVVSNSCRPCKVSEDDPQKDGLGYGLRRLIAERARTAREGVEIAAELVEKYGYFSARCYQICDKEEGWSFQVTTGPRYAARRVQDDEVYFIPNWYTIHEIDWNDTEHKNYYFSPDLVEYPIRRGWYAPAKEGDFSDFDFAAAYQQEADDTHNILRTRNAWRLLGHELTEARPFSYKLDRKLGVEDLKGILRSHYEGTEDAAGPDYSVNPHRVDPNPVSLCNTMTAESSIVEFAEEAALTCIWRSCPKPCIGPYVPFYVGITTPPKGYSWLDPQIAQKTHFCPAAEELAYDPTRAYWALRTLQYLTEFDYQGAHQLLHASIAEIEKGWTAEQPAVREAYRKLAAEDPQGAAAYLTGYTAAKAQAAWDWANAMIQKIGERKIIDNNDSLKPLYE